MKVDVLTPVYVTYMPDELEEGRIYISKEFCVAIHLCACGCGHEVVTTVDDGSNGWQLSEQHGGIVSLHPSIGNFYFPCKSHYFIKNNKIEWC